MKKINVVLVILFLAFVNGCGVTYSEHSSVLNEAVLGKLKENPKRKLKVAVITDNIKPYSYGLKSKRYQERSDMSFDCQNKKIYFGNRFHFVESGMEFFPLAFESVDFVDSYDEKIANKYDAFFEIIPGDLSVEGRCNRRATIEMNINVNILKNDGTLFSSQKILSKGYGEGYYDGHPGVFVAARNLTNNFYYNLSLEYLKNSSSISEYISFFEEKKKSETIKATSPSELIVKFKYTDTSSLIPNNYLDSFDKASIKATLKNQGKGKAFAVKLQTETKYPGISIPKEIEVGDIQPGETKEVSIPVEADLSLQTGTASFLITAREKRGFDARPVELQVPTAALQKPELMVASCNLNDSSGLGQGDGDSQPENNETIELSPYIKNEGVGAGLKVQVQLTDVTPGIEIVKGSDDLAVVEPGALGKATLAFKVPRTFSGSEIKYTVVARDVRGMETSQTYTHAFASSAPQLQYSYQVVDSQNREAPGLENGRAYTLRITPQNIGTNKAEGVKVKVNAASGKVGLGHYSGSVGSLAAGGESGAITIPVAVARSFTDRVLELDVAMTQDGFSGFDQKITLPVQVTQPLLEPQVVLLNGMSSDTISENSHPSFRVSISNKGNLDAENVKIRFRSQHKDASQDQSETIGTVKAGESQYRDFTFFVRGGVKLGELPIAVEISQADFDSETKTAMFTIVEQTAIVQKVEGVNQAAGMSKAVYAGPPEIYINTPNDNLEVFKSTIHLHGSVILFGTGNDVVDFKVSVNGQNLKVLPVTETMKLGPDLITRRQVEGNKIVFDGEVNLAPEANEIKIVCLDRNGQERTQIVKVSKKAKLGNIYAVVVGISDFANPAYNLNYAASDAGKFYEFLRSEKGGALPDNRIKLLTNYQATRAGIIEAMTKFLGRAAKEDTVEIYLATHGLPGDDGVLYYLAYDTDIGNLFGTGFSNNDLQKIVKDNIQAGRVILYLDACHAGMSGLSGEMYAKRGVGVFEVNQKINGLAAQLSKTAAGVTTLSASSSTGYSLEDNRWGGGAFTYSLLRGLNGEANENADEWVSLDELENFLTRDVFVLTEGKQKPKVNGTLIGETTVLSKVE